jgi:hypothetical protein
MTTLFRPFVHRQNEDGSIASICQLCYVTVVTATWETDLERAETGHKCDRERLGQFETTHKQPFQTTWMSTNRQS